MVLYFEIVLELCGSYSDFFGEGEYVEGVEGVGDVGKGDDYIVGFSDGEIGEGDFCWFGDEGFFSLESFLLFGHVEAVKPAGFLCLLFLEGSEFTDI